MGKEKTLQKAKGALQVLKKGQEHRAQLKAGLKIFKVITVAA